MISKNPKKSLTISHFVHPLLLIIFLINLQPDFLSAQNFDWERLIRSKARKIDGQLDYASLHDLADVLKAQTYYSNKVRKAILYLGSQKITLTAFNPFVLVDQTILQMPINTMFMKGDIYVPLQYFLPIVKSVISNQDDFTSFYGKLDLKKEINITGVQVVEKANGTLIRVKTLKDFNESSISTRYSRGWLYVDFLHGKIDEKSFTRKIEKGLVKKIVPVQSEQMVQLSFQLNSDIPAKNLNITKNAREVWISIPTKDKLNPKIIAKINSDKEKWRIDRIVLDPGHGGRDPGTIGKNGIYEKDVVLAIAKKVKDLIRRKTNMQVFMTRDSDVYLTLPARTQLANKKQGKLFISIHANWNRNSRVNGASTYFLGLAKSEEALEIAQLENAVIKFDDHETNGSQYNDESIILAAMAQNDYNKESQDFAAMVQKSIKKYTGLVDRGVKQAGFYVLVGASMPNVLIETAFLSNRNDERNLKSRSFQQKMANAIFTSIMQFKEKYENILEFN
ncbi:MAG: N-acetylmuramoyl-L-alanine amidase [bacterium]